MKRTVAAAAAVILVMCVCGCGGGYRTKITKEEQDTDYSTVYAEIIEFSRLENEQYMSDLNEEIRNGVEAYINNFDALAQEASTELPEGVKSALRITQNVKRNNDGIISFVEKRYMYLGGAHGSTEWYPRTINAREAQPHELTLGEMFNDGDYTEKINLEIDKLIEENPEKYSELWAVPHITAETENRFYITDNELIIFFPPYELSYYARGFVEFPIRFEALGGYIKEEYTKDAG